MRVIGNRLSVKSSSVNRWLAAACLLALVSHATPSSASSLLASVTPQERAACTPDVMRLCGSAIPSVPRVIACMKRERPNLSPACASAYDARMGHKTATRSIGTSL